MRNTKIKSLNNVSKIDCNLILVLRLFTMTESRLAHSTLFSQQSILKYTYGRALHL